MISRTRLIAIIIIFTFGFASACGNLQPTLIPPENPTSPPQATLAPTQTVELPTSTIPAPTLTPTPAFQLCSPLKGISLSDLPRIVTNPFQLPPISLDDGHHGVDFAFYQFLQFKTMEGLPITAVLAGKVAAIDINRPPYGNMIIIETPLEQIPFNIQVKSLFPTIAPTAVNDGRLSCPASGPSPTYSPVGRSLYILYAHMKNAPTLHVGDSVSQCQEIGQVGTTGESSQFHLHLETRIGPADARFTSIAHRDTSATDEEMYNYCVWRISNIFEKFDPMQLLSLQP